MTLLLPAVQVRQIAPMGVRAGEAEMVCDLPLRKTAGLFILLTGILFHFSGGALAEGWGSIEGRFLLGNPVPQIPTIAAVAACGPRAIPNDAMQFDPETGGIANIFVYLRRAPTEIHPDLLSSSQAELEFNQEGCRFLPHALIVRTDQVVICKSRDAVAHNLHTNPFANTPENFVIQPGQKAGVPIRMARVEALPVKIQCDVHPWMGAWWVVLDHPYSALTDRGGNFKIENLPAGEHEFRVWHERVGYINRSWKVTVQAGETTVLPPQPIALSRFQ